MNPIVITGATGSMGAVTTEALALEGTPVILACRNLSKGEAVIAKIRARKPDTALELMELDLSRRSSVEAFAGQLEGRRLGGLFNNAGMMARRYALTEDGYEQDMAVNCINTSLLTQKLLPLIEDGGHVVSMVSLSTRFVSLNDDWMKEDEAKFSQLGTYARSKLALLYFSIALARNNPRLHINVSDPGIVNSRMITMDRWFDPLADVLFRPFINSPEKGARPAIAALHADDSLRYFVGRHCDPIPQKYQNSTITEKIWDILLQNNCDKVTI